jgi:hypothetical protein
MALIKRKFEQDGFTVIVKHIIDEDSDYSSLTQEYADCTPEEQAENKAQDAARLRGLERGDWYYMGVAVSILKQTKSNWANGGLEVGRASVWGIESDSEPSYIAEVERDMVAEAFSEVNRLREALCIPVSQSLTTTRVPSSES